MRALLISQVGIRWQFEDWEKRYALLCKMEGPQTVGCPGNLPDLAGSKRPAFRLCSRCKGRRNQRIICCKSPEKGIEPIAYCEIAGLFAGFEIQKYGADLQKIVDFPSVSSPLLAPFGLL